ncbi:CPBP family intramembrane glutamic endopeptidase [Sinomonas gamaensis]|uniref:CPBP family intramembrane glutamic endopeptidase n=1 Tax=Sinomonas gamaensis TaxID=2565624 RepID=UPI0011099F79|nr:CPBP family intramembrane glutamic endopeptidase [Sinomonas gamaensis]
MDTLTAARPRHLLLAGVGLLTTLLGAWGLETLAPPTDSVLLNLAAYAVAWVPTILVLVLAFRGLSRQATSALLGLRFRPIDLVWGVGIGFVGRSVDAVLRLAVVGSTGLSQQPTISAIAAPIAQTVALGIIAPVLIAPVLEEVYFRGLIQRSAAALLEPLGPVTKWTAAVILTSLAFALVHALLLIAQPEEAMLAGVSTFVFALLAGTMAAATNRLGGAVVGHVVFNGLGVLLTWPA